jgi:hypothetical protein
LAFLFRFFAYIKLFFLEKVMSKYILISLLLVSLDGYAQQSSKAGSSASSSSSVSPLSGDAIRQEQIKKLTIAYQSWGHTSPDVLAKVAVDHGLDRKTLSSKAEVPDLYESHWLNKVQIDGQRFYSNDFMGATFPGQLKCTIHDKRIFHFCLEPEFFLPSARVYFDRGADQETKLDMFNNGRVNINLDFASVYIPWRLSHAEYFDNWSWGPQFGVGITTSAITEKDEEAKADTDNSSSPVVMTSFGLKVRYKTSDNGANIGFEIGKGWGYSTDESFADIKDRAYYVGLSLKVAMPEKK